MKPNLIGFVVCLLLAGCSTQHTGLSAPTGVLNLQAQPAWGTLSNGTKCNIGLPKSSYPVLVRVTFRNRTNKDIWVPTVYYRVDPEHAPAFRSGIDPVVIDEAGNRLTPVSDARVKVNEVGQTLSPGDQTGFEFNLLDSFKISQPGWYTLRLEFTKQYSGFAEGESNTVGFHVPKESNGA